MLRCQVKLVFKEYNAVCVFFMSRVVLAHGKKGQEGKRNEAAGLTEEEKRGRWQPRGGGGARL